MQVIIGQVVSIPFTSIDLVTGKDPSLFSPIFLVNGSPLTISPLTYSEIGNGLYTITFTPALSGSFSMFIEDQLILDIEVVNRTNTQILQNLEDDAIGSWIWDKVAGTLNIIRQDGSPLANFNIVDTLDIASRERV